MKRLALAALSLVASVRAAEPPAAVAPDAEFPVSWNYGKELFADSIGVLGAPLRWSGPDWLVAGGVLAGTGALAAGDTGVRRAFQRSRTASTDRFSSAISPWAAGWREFALMGAVWGTGFAAGDRRLAAAGLDMFAARFVASGIIVSALKGAAGRSRPFDEHGPFDFHPITGDTSFPSAHAAQAFSMAAALCAHEPAWWVQVPVYSFASAVALSRLNDDVHWSSDVFFGAALGFAVGKAVSALNDRLRASGWRLAPG